MPETIIKPWTPQRHLGVKEAVDQAIKRQPNSEILKDFRDALIFIEQQASAMLQLQGKSNPGGAKFEL